MSLALHQHADLVACVALCQFTGEPGVFQILDSAQCGTVVRFLLHQVIALSFQTIGQCTVGSLSAGNGFKRVVKAVQDTAKVTLIG